MFATAIHIHFSLIFAGKVRSLPLEWSFGSGGLHVLPTKIRLGWKSVQVANTLAYYDTLIITAVKSFIDQAPGSSIIKRITAVIYRFP